MINCNISGSCLDSDELNLWATWLIPCKHFNSRMFQFWLREVIESFRVKRFKSQVDDFSPNSISEAFFDDVESKLSLGCVTQHGGNVHQQSQGRVQEQSKGFWETLHKGAAMMLWVLWGNSLRWPSALDFLQKNNAYFLKLISRDSSPERAWPDYSDTLCKCWKDHKSVTIQ